TLSPTTGGTWISSNTSIATVTNAGVITGVSAGSVTFTFTDGTTGCTNTTTSVTVNARPLTFNVTGGGSYCTGGIGVPVGLDATESNSISYQLWINGTNSGQSVP